MDPEYPYTVRSVDMVFDFFKYIVFRRYATRKISLKRNVEIPIGVRDEASSSTSPPPTLQQMLEVAPKDPQGNYTIRVPLSKSAVEQYKKALLRLYQYQEETRRQTITWPSPAASRLIMDQLKAHYLNLVYDSLHTRPNLTASSLYRDAYTPRQLTKVLRKLWMQNNMPELLSISLRHSFVLRDQDLRGLNFGDCFSLVTPFVNNPGSQQPVCFVLCIDKGKTLKNGEVKFTCAFRHINIHRCPISGMAFYLFGLMQDNGSFLNEPYWYEYKVVPGRSGPTSERSKAANINSAKAIFESHGFYSSKKTHAGRHSVTIEAESLGVAVDEIKRGGGWKDHLGRLETFYLGKLSWQFARGLAGYLDKPFNLDRNAVKPPIELQRMVFPWIENFFGADDALWKQTCQEEMDEIDETSTLNTDPYQQQPQPPHQMKDSLSIIHEMAKLGKSVKEEAKRSTRRQAEEPSADEQQHRQEQLRTLYSSNDVAKRGFLKHLLRLRRVLLQDAAYLIHYRRYNSLLEKDLFTTPQFLEFQNDVMNAMATSDNNRLQDFEELVPNIVDTDKDLATKIADMNRQMEQEQRRNQEALNSITSSLSHHVRHQSQQQATLATISAQLQHLAASQQALHMNQQFCLSQMQFLASAFAPAPVPAPVPAPFHALATAPGHGEIPSAAASSSFSFPAPPPPGYRPVASMPQLYPAYPLPRLPVSSAPHLPVSSAPPPSFPNPALPAPNVSSSYNGGRRSRKGKGKGKANLFIFYQQPPPTD